MTFASGNQIQATDYNALASILRQQLGTDTGQHGLGQDVSSIANVSTANTVTATQWTNLISRANAILAHEGQTTITPSSVTAGTPVTAYAAITTGVNTSYTNTGTTALAKSNSAATAATTSAAWGAQGSRDCVFNHTVTFASGNHARYFFNAGGSIKISCAKSGGSSPSNASWQALVTALGTIDIGFRNTTRIGGSGTITLKNTNNGGYWSGTGSFVEHALQYSATVGYTGNCIQVAYYWSGTTANGGNPVLNIRTTWYNNTGAVGLTNIDGTSTTNLVVSHPSTTQLANTWGAPTVGTSVVPSSGTLGMTLALTIASNVTDYVLYNAATAAGWNPAVKLNVTVTVNSGVYVGSTSPGSYAFIIHSSAYFPAGSTITLINNGYILGMGGTGGAGGAAGNLGGYALHVGMAATIYNYGYIYGGGGGGGGMIYLPYYCGGGGGGGYNGGTGGTGPHYAGSAGSTWSGGAGVYLGAGVYSGAGGAAGSPGLASATPPYYAPYQNAGGPAGYYIVGNANVTWAAVGYRAGNVG